MMTQWLCQSCKTLLAFIDGEVMRIKRKDVYVEVEGGRVMIICRKCGKRNETVDDKFHEVQEARAGKPEKEEVKENGL